MRKFLAKRRRKHRLTLWDVNANMEAVQLFLTPQMPVHHSCLFVFLHLYSPFGYA